LLKNRRKKSKEGGYNRIEYVFVILFKEKLATVLPRGQKSRLELLELNVVCWNSSKIKKLLKLELFARCTLG